MTDHSTDAPLLAIGELSRASGLTVSSLRFYDREGLLVPAEVDPVTGYRRYSPGQVRAARLLAGMRRVGMPLAEMAAVLDALPDAPAAEDLLAAHLRRLADGLADARREVDRLRSLLPGCPPGTWTARLGTGDLARALGAVRHAVGSDPDFPMLAAVLAEPADDALRLVATDRHRLAMAEAPATLGGSSPGSMSLLPTALVDRLLRAVREVREGQVHLTLTRTACAAELPDGRRVGGDCLDLDYPDYRRVVREQPTGPSARVAVADILASLASGAPTERVVLHPGGVRPVGSDEVEDGVLVDREFLWDAASAVGDGHAVLPLGGPVGPLTFHDPDDTIRGLLMPVRAEPEP